MSPLLPRQREAYRVLLDAEPESYTFLGFGGAAGGSKGLSLDTPIPTPAGWTTMGDLKEGDYVFAPDGTPTRVIHLSEIHHRPCYRVTLSDGASLVADDEHRWSIYQPKDRIALSRRTDEFRAKRRASRPSRVAGNRTAAQTAGIIDRNKWLPPPTLPPPGPQTISTLELKAQLGCKGKRPAIAVASALELPDREDLLLEPYLFGAWLGDGTTGDGSFTTADQEMVDAWGDAGWDIRHRPSGKYTYGIRGLKAVLRDMGVLGNKHIPQEYLRASRAQRLELLRGLMDTDGTRLPSGAACFTNTNKRIVDATAELIRSLGWRVMPREHRATLYGVDKGPVWDLKWTPNEAVFRLPRKAAGQSIGGERTRWRYVESIEPVDMVPTRCMYVEHESHCYIAGRDFITTHNTFFNARVAIELCLAFPGTRILVARQTLVSLKTTTMEEFYRQLPPELIYKRNDSENFCKVRNNTWPPGLYSIVYFRGIEDYQQKGSEAYQVIIIDEASETARAAAEYLITRLRWRLPKVVQKRMEIQCRKIDDILGLDGRPTGEWKPCGRICPDRVCPIHGEEFIGNGVRYFFIATSNPWPGWFSDWFYKRSGLNLDSLPKASVHFIQSLPSDNPYNGPNYVDVLRASLSPDMVKRMVEGRFDVFAGLVYEGFNPSIHQWHGPIPDYHRVIGGLDFGQESSTAHFTTGIVGLVTTSGRLIRVDEFKERGPNVYERQALWMQKMQEKWAKPIGKKIEWRGDRSQAVGIRYMKQAGGFFITMSKGGPDSVDAGIKHVAELLNVRGDKYPGSFYLPGGHEMGGCPQWEQEMREYARDPDTMKVVKERDDLTDADRYMHELLSALRGDPGKIFKGQISSMQ